VGAASGEGPFSCTAYPPGIPPGPDDLPGTAGVRFSLSGRGLNFEYCLGDVGHAAGPSGPVFTVTLADRTESASGIEYRYVLGIAGTEHTVGTHAVSAAGPVWADIYMLVSDVQGAVIRVVWLGYAARGWLAYTQIGDGVALETKGSLGTTVHYEANEVVCDNSEPDPLRHCPR
jgi:hypothetical protein